MSNPKELLLPNGNLSQITTYQAGILQASAHRLLQKYCDEVLAQYGITKMQWLIIGATLDAGTAGIRLTDLSEKLGTTLSYITGEINLLEAKKIMIRTNHGTDSRSKLISISKHYVPKCDEIENTLREILRKTIYAEVEPAEFKVYIKVLFQLGKVNKIKS